MGQAASTHSSVHSDRSSNNSSSSRLPSGHSARDSRRQSLAQGAHALADSSDHNAHASHRRSFLSQNPLDFPHPSSNLASEPILDTSTSTIERDPLMEVLDSHNPPPSAHSNSDISMRSCRRANNRSRSSTVADSINNQSNIENRGTSENTNSRFGLLSRNWSGRSEARPSRITSSRITRRRLTRSPYSTARGDCFEGPPTDRLLSDGEATVGSSRTRLNRRSRLSHVRHSIAHPISHFFSQEQSRRSNNGRPTSSPHTTTASSSRMSLDPIPDDNVYDRPSDHNAGNQGASSDTERSPFSFGGVPNSLGEDVSPLSRVLHMAATAIAAQLSGRPGSGANLQPLGEGNMDRSLQTLVQSLQQATANSHDAEHSTERGGNDVTQEQQQQHGQPQQREQQQHEHLPSQQTQPHPQPQQPPGDGTSPHVNFLRAFLFSGRDGEQDTASGDGHSDSNPPPLTTDNTPGADQTDDRGAATPNDPGRRRLVTLVIVGVRPIIPSNDSGNSNGETDSASGNNENHSRSALDSLINVPMSSTNPLRRRRSQSPEESRHGSRFLRGFSNDMAETVPRSESEQQSVEGGRRQTRQSLPSSYQNPSSLSSSPGPMPPPTTPAGPNQSSTNSPRRPSYSLDDLLAIPTIEEHGGNADVPDHSVPGQSDGSLENESAESFLNTVRHRRRSASEAARHRGLGSGSARRNGMVEPDGTLPVAGRSWMIYVVGTNLSENHPALATPSLFTDVSFLLSFSPFVIFSLSSSCLINTNRFSFRFPFLQNPSYEDLTLLSTLLGPVKPPVASQNDVNASGGIYRIVTREDSLVAEPVNAEGDSLPLAPNERCLICLSDYQANEENRRLMRCKHIYHKVCIDEVRWPNAPSPFHLGMWFR